MTFIKSKFIIVLAVLLGVVGFAQASERAPLGAIDNGHPDLPAQCAGLVIGPDEAVAFHVYAIGVQIYRWNGSAWDFTGPSANLYADSGYHGKVGSHYGGPTWESNSGSKVIGRKINDCAPDTSAVAWLLLETVTTDGPGIFANVSHIQRVNTTGGIKPAAPGAIVGEEKGVPYTAEYYFYRRLF